MSNHAHRRVVTGLDAEGKSCVIFDGPAPRTSPGANIVWRNATTPADNSGTADEATAYGMDRLHDGGVNFVLVELAPDQDGETFMQATDTIDYLVVTRGEITLVLEAGDVVLRPGDLIVDRGVIHGWRNDGDEPAAMVAVTVPAHPVGKGRTI